MYTRSESSAKRMRESMQESPLEKSTKPPRLSSEDKAFFRDLIKESELFTSQIIKSSIKDSEEKHFNFINTLIKESEVRILSLIEEKINNIQVDLNKITERVHNLEMKSSDPTEVTHLKDEIVQLRKKILKSENSVVAGSVRINGIPYRENENLHSIVENICDSLKIHTPQVESIYRLKKIYKNNKPYKPSDEVIVAKFKSPFGKNFLLKSIANFRRNNKSTLCLRNAGFESNEPIYVNENLTPHNHQIFKAALNLKKGKRIKSTFTLRGLVYVKKFDSDEPLLIESPEELAQLFLE